MTAPFLARKYLDSIRDDEKMTLKTFARKVTREYSMCPSRIKLQRARRIALGIIYGDELAQYLKLWDYAQELRFTNPGSCLFLSVEEITTPPSLVPLQHFSTLYFNLDACKRGFLRGCRPLICIDGCHLKTKFGGILFTAVGIDPNDCIFPIAMGVVEVEATASWRWFLDTLKNDLNIVTLLHGLL